MRANGPRKFGYNQDNSDAENATGMSYFEQSIYAIEEFITVRKKMGATWKQDKYLLALTASNPESNAAIEIELQLNEGAGGADGSIGEEIRNEEDAILYKIG